MSPSQLQSISTYIDILLRWNARINLTAIRDPEEIVTRHFGESLFAARHLFPKVYPVPSVSPVAKDVDVDAANDRRPTTNGSIRVADLGSGAGFPGIPIKLWAPNITLTLVESNHKKATFLREVARALRLTHVNIQNVRAEKLPPSTFDVITIRAVEGLTNILPLVRTLLVPSGRLALLVGSSQLDAARSAVSSFTWDPPTRIPESKSRVLILARLS